MNGSPHGFWVRGGKDAPRELVNAARAFAGFAASDDTLKLDREHYLSAFTFGEDFRAHLREHHTTTGYSGPCGADYLWLDIDREGDLGAALADTRALALHLGGHWGVPDDALLAFFSGAKGFHLGVPTPLWIPAPSASFNLITKKLALAVAGSAGERGVAIDTGVYDKVRLFRAPNSRHPKSGLYKVRLTLDELLHLSTETILARAGAPYSFELPDVRRGSDPLVAGWENAEREVVAEQQAMAERSAAIIAKGGPTRLNALTLEFIREGAPVGGGGAPAGGGRHNRLYAAAINLGEFGCPAPLAHALLTDPARDCGLPPAEIRRTIDNALRGSGGGRV